jgi:3-carboxy-cis,cis-muconate cycloisomerase
VVVAGLELLYSDEACEQALSDEALLAAMARFEGALARALAEAGLMPAAEASAIDTVCSATRFDAAALARAGRRAGALAIPFVTALTEQVAVVSPQAARHVHRSATSQDVVDTGLALCLTKATGRLLELTRRAGDAAARLAEQHADTPTVARTLLQPAAPIPFGWKAAVWLSMLSRGYRHFAAAAHEACMLQFGGAAGTLGALENRGEQVAQALSTLLALPLPDITWHSARDRLARLACESAMLSGVAAKIARDVSLLMQPEVAEVSEPGAGGSSSMPHKRNPKLSLAALAAAQRAPGLAATLLGQLAPEHERGLGQWQAQWQTLRELLGGCGGALAAMAEALEGLQVHVSTMEANLLRDGGLAFSERVAVRLASALGKAPADRLTQRLCEAALRQGKSLAQALAEDPESSALITPQERATLFDPKEAFGSARGMIERVLAEWRALPG